jgi:hypothetical protein
VFLVGAVITIVAGVLARTLLAPMRKRCIEESNVNVEKDELRRTKQYA